MANDLEVKAIYTKGDFLDSFDPYEEVYSHIGDRFELNRALEKMAGLAKEVGIKNFKTLFKDYCQTMKALSGQTYIENMSNFDGQPMELNTGPWTCDDYGVSRQGPFGEIVACVHPIMPVRRLVNVDSRIVKLEIAFKQGNEWSRVIFDKKLLASATSIVSTLADYGVAVTSENAKYLVQYLHDVENLNYDKIPESRSVSRLGWIGETWFSPYGEDLIFDGDISFRYFFESVHEQGSFDKWVKAVRSIREQGNVPAKMLVASSFASALVGPCSCLPFFVHLWGGTETGKTVGLMLAASVWANPQMGKYIHTFNSTQVAQELSAGFVNSMPLLLDELQIIKDKKDFDHIIYQLAEGVGKSRGQKTGGLQRVSTWQNCIITTGEQPISSSHSGGGAINRIIEVNCEEVKLFDDPGGLVETIQENYGHAGKAFIEYVKDTEVMKTARLIQKGLYQDLARTQITEKQALAASLILTADGLIDGSIFKDNNGLTVSEVAGFLSTKEEVSVNVRAYAWLNDWIAQHGYRFDESNAGINEVWGKYSQGKLYIIRNKFNEACAENGFSDATFLPWLRKNGHLYTSKKGFTWHNTINRARFECVALRRDYINDTEVDEE
jgi:hypothetical protein